MTKRELQDGFQIRVAGEDSWYPMTVPGSAMDTFCREGILPNPYYGTNEYQVREFFRNDFEIRSTFQISEEELEKEQILLIFHGIDTVADIFLNGNKIGHTENMHRIYPFSVKEWVKEGENLLEFYIKSPIVFMESYVPEKAGRFIWPIPVRWQEDSISERVIPCLAGTGARSSRMPEFSGKSSWCASVKQDFWIR